MGGRVLVTGGSGVVGMPLVQRLVADRRDVVALSRSPASDDIVRALGAEPARGDVLDTRSVRDAADGCESVFHVAGVNAMCVRDASAMDRVNVEGTATVVRASAAAGVRRVVVTSSAAAIGEREGEVGRESSAHRGSYLSRYERSKHLGERVAFATGAETGVDVVCVNPASVQGPGRVDGSARLLLATVRRRRVALVDAWISLVDVRDCTEGHVLAERHGSPGARYVLSGASTTTRDAVDLIRRLWGRPDRVRWLPRRLAYGAGAVAETVGRVAGRDVPVCREAVRTLLHGHRYDGTFASRELGLAYTPLETTLETTLEWYAERGLIPPRDDGQRA